MVLNAQQRETKALATAILEANGGDYDQALDDFHQEIISNNRKTIIKGLNALKSTKRKDGKEERGKENEIVEKKRESEQKQ